MKKFAFSVFVLAATIGLAQSSQQQTSRQPSRSNQPADLSNQPRDDETDISEMRKTLKEIETGLIDEMPDEVVRDRLARARRLVADNRAAFGELADIEKKLTALAEKYPHSHAAQRARQAAVILRGTAADGTVDR